MNQISLKLKTSLFFLLICVLSVNAQFGYDTTYNGGRLLSFRNILWNKDSTLLISGIYRDDTSKYQQLIILNLDTLGQILHSIIITDSLYSSHLAMNDDVNAYHTDEYSLVFPFGFFNRGSLGICFLSDIQSDPLIKEYSFDSLSYINPKKIIQIGNDWFIIGESQVGLNSTNAFLLKLDKNKSVVWIKYYGNSQNDQSFQDIIKINDTLMLIGGFNTADLDDNSWIITIDTSGKKLYEWSYPEPTFYHGAVLAMIYDSIQDLIYYLSTTTRITKFPGESWEVSTPILVTLDESLDVIAVDSLGTF
jgi:hypothetical protein